MKALLSWSSGKDSAWALHVLRAQRVDVVGLMSTVREGSSRVAIHDVRPELVQAQADAIGLPLRTLPLPDPCPNDVYERIMGDAMRAAVAEGISHVAFGDLFLSDIRAYREEKLRGSGITPLFPIFGADTTLLARDMIDEGFRAVLVTTDDARLAPSFCGRTFDDALLRELPDDVDPCGENGEFHTFTFAGPIFRAPLSIEIGAREQRDGYTHVDVTSRGSDRR